MTEVPADKKNEKWVIGDYHAIAKGTLWELGPLLVTACGVSAGQRILDVATGTGNAAIRAAQAGATVIATDLVPEHFEVGRKEATAHGVSLEWQVADAQALPFADNSFDVVLSILGAILAPNHQVVADELLRVVRPGGTIGMINLFPEGAGPCLLQLLATYEPEPPPPGTPSPVLWGREEYVRSLFGDRIEILRFEPGLFVEKTPESFAPGPAGYCDFLREIYGPLMVIYQSLADKPERKAALDRDLLDFATRWNRAALGELGEYHFDSVLLVCRKRSA